MSSAIGSADPDAALVAAAQRGERQALDDLLRRHQARLWAVCRRVTGSDADADDAAQEALIAVGRGLRAFDGRSRFGTWAYRIAVNASLDELRRRRRRPQPGLPGDPDLGGVAGAAASRSEGPLGPGDQNVAGSHGGEPRATTGDPEAAALTVDIDRALRRLPPEFRAAVVLRDLCGLDYAEIAEILGVPAGTVRSRISRGRAALAPLLTPGNSTADPRRPTSRP